MGKGYRQRFADWVVGDMTYLSLGVIPEPGTLSLLALGMVGVMALYRDAAAGRKRDTSCPQL